MKLIISIINLVVFVLQTDTFFLTGSYLSLAWGILSLVVAIGFGYKWIVQNGG